MIESSDTEALWEKVGEVAVRRSEAAAKVAEYQKLLRSATRDFRIAFAAWESAAIPKEESE